MRAMRVVLGLLFVAALSSISGCGGRALASFAELCSTGDDCSGDLVCTATRTGSICSASCETDASCMSAYGPMAYCAAGALACLQACETDADCDGDTTCMEGFCEAGMAPP